MKSTGKEVDCEVKMALTEDELLDRDQRLAKACAEKESAERDKAAYNSQIKSRIDRAQADVTKFQSAISNGFEFRSMKCREFMNYEERTVHVVRPDTGEIVESREMTASEYENYIQRQLPGTDECVF